MEVPVSSGVVPAEGPVPVHVASLVNASVAAMRPLLTGCRLGVVVAVDPHLPPLEGDAAQLQRSLQNLLARAATCSPDESTITVTARRRGVHVEIAVEDTGPGMFDADEELGLIVVKAIVEDHCGEVAVRSQAGVGTRVAMTLPVYAAA